MKIVIAGGSGFIGQNLNQYFNRKGYMVKTLSRKPNNKSEVLWDGKTLGYWVSELDGADVLINLAGKSVDCRYNEKNKTEIHDSRVDSTRILQLAMNSVKNPPKIWINSSTATIYEHSLKEPNDEINGKIGHGFSVNVAKAWEKEFFSQSDEQTRKVALRSSIVLGKQGGALQPFIGLAKFGLGGKQGNGLQMVSWIHTEDFSRAVDFIIEHKNIEGCINITSPNPLRNTDFVRCIRKVFGLNFGLTAPKFLLKIGVWLLRTEAELVLKSRFVVPHRLLENGFEFKYPNLQDALIQIKNEKSR